MLLLSEILAEVDARIARETESLANGAATSFDKYTEKVGILKGLKAARTIMVDTVKAKPMEERS